MTFNAHRSPMLPQVAMWSNAVYHLTGIQSAAWHARDREGEVVRAEIRAAAAKRGVPIYDVTGKLLEPVDRCAAGG